MMFKFSFDNTQQYYPKRRSPTSRGWRSREDEYSRASGSEKSICLRSLTLQCQPSRGRIALAKRSVNEDTEACVVNIDKLTHAANLQSIPQSAAAGRRYRFTQLDICNGPRAAPVIRAVPAAVCCESHIDRSIDAPAAFIETTAVGGAALLAYTRRESS